MLTALRRDVHLEGQRPDLVEQQKSVRTGAQVEALQSGIAAFTTAQTRIATIDGSVAQLQRHIQTVEARLDSIAKQAEKLRRVSGYRSLITEGRDVLSVLPRKVCARMMRALELGLNERLSFFDMPFFVRSEQNLTFTCVWPDKSLPITRLSGGESVAAAIAFYLTLNERVIKHVGFMVLDEPTAYLERKNVEAARQVFTAMTERVALSGTQMIVISHEPELASAFGLHLDLGAA